MHGRFAAQNAPPQPEMGDLIDEDDTIHACTPFSHLKRSLLKQTDY